MYKNNTSKSKIKQLISVFVLLIPITSFGQTVFWTESFGVDNNCANRGQLASVFTGDSGPWTITATGTNAPYSNKWYISAAEADMGIGNCSNSCVTSATLTAQSLHVGATGGSSGDYGAQYDKGINCFSMGICATTDSRANSPTVDCAGKMNITLQFAYLAGGQISHDYGEVYYSPDNGSTWNFLATPTPTTLCGWRSIWQSFSMALPSDCNNNPNVKIGFRWQNDDDGNGTNPSFAIAELALLGDPLSVEDANMSINAQSGNKFSNY